MPVLSFLTFVFVASFTPGPNNIIAMAFANQYGLNKTITFCLGVGSGFFVIVFISSVFNILLTNLMPIIHLPLTIFGVVYMLYLAVKILTSKDSQDQENTETQRNFFFSGLLLQFVNPKGILFGITVVATFILPYYNSYYSYFSFSLFLGCVGLMSTFTWSLCGSVFQNFLTQYQRPFNIIMAVLLVYSAITILVS